MNETTKNFIEVFSTLEPWQLPAVLYRLYYDDRGHPLEYSHEDRPGNYIDVTPEIFRSSPMNVRVIDRQLKLIDSALTTKKLVPAQKEGVCCDPRDVCVIVSPNLKHIKWTQRTYDHWREEDR